METQTLRYDSHDDAEYDLHFPDAHGMPTRLVAFFHGGFWRSRFGRLASAELVAAFAATGPYSASIEYRRYAPDAPFDYRNTLRDAHKGLIAVWEHATAIAGRPIEVVVVGHSAGGHLALWLASEELPFTVSRVVALAPVANLERAYAENLGSGAVGEFLGGAPSAEVLEETSPAHRFRRAAPDAAIVVIHGTDDESVPLTQAAEVRRAHAAARIVELPGHGHFEFLTPGTEAWAAAVESVR